MKKIKAICRPVPRWGWIVINITAIALVLFLRYIFAGAPAYSMENAFRRAENAKLVGPSEILDTITVDIGSYNRLIVADDGDGAILYTWLVSGTTHSSMSGKLVYRKKTGGVTVVPAPAHGLMFTGESASLPVIVFDEFPDAVRAELDLHLYETGNAGANPPASLDFNLTADREVEGYFLFTVSHSGNMRLGKEVQMINDLGNTSIDSSSCLYCAYPATVRLYDEGGKMIYEQTLVIRSLAGYACERDGKLPDNVLY